MSFYTSTSDARLADDIVLQCGKLYVREYLSQNSGVMTTPGATATLVDTNITADDEFNDKTLFIKDDNDLLCSVNIDDTALAGTELTIDTTSALQVSDGTTAGSFTTATTYNFYILNSEEFVGYSTQTLDYEEETVEFLDCNDLVRQDITRVVLGFSGECKNLSADKTLANIFGLTEYGSQTSQVEYHGGFTPAAKKYYQAILKTENVVPKDIDIKLFKGQFFGGGAIDFGAAGEYKVVPYSFKAYKDTLRDSSAVNGWSVRQTT